MKYNPFRPNGIVAPGMFVGRIDELLTIEQCLHQARHGNPQHFLIEGERGIGKSSLLFLGEHIAKGTVNPITAGASTMKFLTVSVDMGGVETQLDIVRAIARQLKQSLALRDALKEKALKVWEFISKWEVAGVRYHAENEGDSEDARDELVNRLAELLADSQGEIEGVFIIIDEADAPPEGARLGEFLKLFTERLSRRGCNLVLLGLAGLPSTIPKLRASHESAPRLLEVMPLDPLTGDERKQVVRRGLEEAEKINNFKTEIDDDAISLIADLSEGYPHFIQQFSYCAFSEDNDNKINATDVTRGAYKDNGALMQLGHKYFTELYKRRIASDDYRTVLAAMAKHGDEWLTSKQITDESKELGVSSTNVTNALAALKDRNIILRDDSRRGFYKLPTKSFAAWINAIRALQFKSDTNVDLFGTPSE